MALYDELWRPYTDLGSLRSPLIDVLHAPAIHLRVDMCMMHVYLYMSIYVDTHTHPHLRLMCMNIDTPLHRLQQIW